MSSSEVVYSVALTSCGRFDLLDRTLKSLIPRLDPPPVEIVVIEDTGDPGVLEVTRAQQREVRTLLNPRRLGQMRSIDRLYSELDTPYVFHCEDDWEFFRGGFVRESHAILAARPDVSMVSLRALSELNPLIRDTPRTTVGGVACHVVDPSRHPEYFGYSFNPGLRRLSDARELGSFAALGGEEDVSYHFRRRGFRYAVLAEPAVRHLGRDQHVQDPFRPPRPRTLPERLARSVRKRRKRLARFLKGER